MTTTNMANFNTTNEQLYFVLVSDPAKRLFIQFVPPELNVTRSATVQSVQIVGRNNPLYQYTAGEKLLSFQLDFYSDVEDRSDVINKCRWLEALAYNDGYAKPPEKVMLVYGELFKNEQWTVKSVNYKLSLFDKENGWMPRQAYVDITLGVDTQIDYKKSDLLIDPV